MAKRNLTKTVPAEFSVGAKAKRSWPLSIKTPRQGGDENEDMSILASLLIDAQLEMTATVKPDGDCEGQQTMPHADKIRPLECVATCSSLRFTSSHAFFRLSLPLDVKPAHVDKFAFRNGKIKLTRIGDRASGDAGEESAEEEAGE